LLAWCSLDPRERCSVSGDGVVARVVHDDGWESLAGFICVVADPEQVDVEGLVTVQTGGGRGGGVYAAPIGRGFVIASFDGELPVLLPSFATDLNADVALVVWVFALPVADEFAFAAGVFCWGAGEEAGRNKQAGQNINRCGSRCLVHRQILFLLACLALQHECSGTSSDDLVK
jgi:hypothetical protein